MDEEAEAAERQAMVDEDEASVEGHAAINNRPLDAGPGQQGRRPASPLLREPPKQVDTRHTGALRAIAASTARTCHGAMRGCWAAIRAT